MEKQNIEEYTLIRTEMQNLKDCMITFIGYVLGGSGIISLGIIALPKSKASYDAYAVLCIIISLLISLVFLILLYKFNSHNRFVGYCKLLNQEILKTNKNK